MTWSGFHPQLDGGKLLPSSFVLREHKRTSARSFSLRFNFLIPGFLLNLSHEGEHLRFGATASERSQLHNRRTFPSWRCLQNEKFTLSCRTFIVLKIIFIWRKFGGGWKLLNSAFCYCDVITFHYFYLRYHFGVFFSVFVFRYRDETTRDVLAGGRCRDYSTRSSLICKVARSIVPSERKSNIKALVTRGLEAPTEDKLQ